jgi:hypothetical protein
MTEAKEEFSLLRLINLLGFEASDRLLGDLIKLHTKFYQ